MYDPVAISVSHCAQSTANCCRKLPLFFGMITVGAAGVILTPLTMAVGLVATTIFGFHYALQRRDHQWLYDKTCINGTRAEFGPTDQKTYIAAAPIKVGSESRKVYRTNINEIQPLEYSYKDSTFTTVQDLHWLQYEYHRLTVKEQMHQSVEKLKTWGVLMIPIIGLAIFTVRAYRTTSVITRITAKKSGGDGIERAKIKIREHFDALKDEILNCNPINSAEEYSAVQATLKELVLS